MQNEHYFFSFLLGSPGWEKITTLTKNQFEGFPSGKLTHDGHTREPFRKIRAWFDLSWFGFSCGIIWHKQLRWPRRRHGCMWHSFKQIVGHNNISKKFYNIQATTHTVSDDIWDNEDGNINNTRFSQEVKDKVVVRECQ